MRKFLILAGGWAVTIVGGLLTPIPLPLPFPVGIMMFLVGCAILTTHSKTFRRGVQFLRHRNHWLSRGLEMITKRAPARVKAMVQMTSPLAHDRHDRMRARRSNGTA
ncbi:MAG TPA: hypothetical protein VGF97_10160 [Rhizomicrobium sp.]|jgi:hypothetical protein